jgi:succinoglycan biosynthesis protein ExoM
MRVVVADNAAHSAARALVDAAASELGLDIAYIHAPAHNISIARNACLNFATAEWIAFLDDDEVASPQWLNQLLAAARRGGWDAVLGPVQALYSPSAPVWIRTGDFHSQGPVYVRGRIETGYTGNVLIRRSLIERQNLRFKVELGRSGGEDADFLYRLSDAGGRIGFEPAALAYEPVVANRASLRWLLRRNFRAGQTHGSRLHQRASGPFQKAGKLLLAAAKAAFCGVATAVYLRRSTQRYRFLMRAALHCGVVARLAGMREIKCY